MADDSSWHEGGRPGDFEVISDTFVPLKWCIWAAVPSRYIGLSWSKGAIKKKLGKSYPLYSKRLETMSWPWYSDNEGRLPRLAVGDRSPEKDPS